MTDERITWNSARADAEAYGIEWAQEHWRDDDDDAYDAAHEYADGCADVIYHYRARAIWADSPDVREYEDDVLAMVGPSGCASIDDAICACAYLAVRDAFADAAIGAVAELRAQETAANQ